MSFTQFNIQLYLIYVYQKNLFNIYVFFNLNITFINKFSLYKKPKKKKVISTVVKEENSLNIEVLCDYWKGIIKERLH